jgi:hypothetical protein
VQQCLLGAAEDGRVRKGDHLPGVRFERSEEESIVVLLLGRKRTIFSLVFISPFWRRRWLRSLILLNGLFGFYDKKNLDFSFWEQ